MKKSVLALFILITMSINLNAQDQGAAATSKFNSPVDSMSYSFGILIGNNMLVQGVKEINMDLFLEGFNAGYKNGTPGISIDAANKCVQDYFNKQVSEEANMNLEKSNAFLAENAKKEGVVTTASGLQYQIVTPGKGEFPKSTDQVKVHYTGKFIDGKIFDSSIERNEPVVFGVDQVIPGWTEALQLMQPGARWMLYIPPTLGYGEQGAGGVIGPNQALIFEVELIEIVK
jgi:FKBP-type peptidyl-prolyl cis-trans isomerase FklB